MKKISRKIAISFLFIIIGFMLCGCSSSSVKVINEYTYDGSIYDESYDYKEKYGYKYFLENNDSQAKLYEEAYLRSVDFKNKEVNLKTSNYATFFEAKCDDYNLTVQEIRQVFELFVYENPMFFFISEIDFEFEGDRVTLELTKDYYSFNDRKKYYKKIDEGLAKFDSAAKSIKGEYETVKFIYNYIRDNMKYCEEDQGNLYYAHNILGFFDNKKGVCESFAETFYLLCQRKGINCRFSFSPDHVWNMVKIYDMWYHFDLTYGYFGYTETYYFLYATHEAGYDNTMIDIPKSAESCLSRSPIALYEGGVEIYRSYSMDDVFNQFDGGDYEIYLDISNAKNDEDKVFYIQSINTNYSKLQIWGHMVNNGDDSYFDCNLYIYEDLHIYKDVFIRKVNFCSIKESSNQMVYHTGAVVVEANAKLVYSGNAVFSNCVIAINEDEFGNRGKALYFYEPIDSD